MLMIVLWILVGTSIGAVLMFLYSGVLYERKYNKEVRDIIYATNERVAEVQKKYNKLQDSIKERPLSVKSPYIKNNGEIRTRSKLFFVHGTSLEGVKDIENMLDIVYEEWVENLSFHLKEKS